MMARLAEFAGHVWFWLLVLIILGVAAVGAIEVILRLAARKAEREMHAFIQREVDAMSHGRRRL